MCEQARCEAAQEGIGAIDTLHDAANAFASTTPAACADTISLHAAREDHPMHDLFLQPQ